ncbi:NYN domain-containing protein [Actinomadura rifamycini]|uniref:NYN domain-containing protein n=1 Tax=Actinomadura rifamycini TaxID=31962 RepID=UPI00047D71FB|nr:NYN domain-containing protein [Actinomadura rifamycini]
MDRCALFVDAGYLLGDGAMAVHGTRHRDAVAWDFSGLLQLLNNLSRERTGLPLLRCYWYEATVEGRRAPEHDALADLPGLKLRLGRIRPGRREGVDTEIHRDLMTLARNAALAEAVLVSGDEDLAQVVADAQDLGVRVTVVHVAVDGNWTISRVLRQECDDLIEIGAGDLRPYVNLLTGMDSAHSSGAHSSGGGSSGASTSGSGTSGASAAPSISSPPSGSVLPGVPIGSSAASSVSSGASPVPSARSAPSGASASSGASPLSNGHGNGASLGSLQPAPHHGPPPSSPITGTPAAPPPPPMPSAPPSPPPAPAPTGPPVLPSPSPQTSTGPTPSPASGGYGSSVLDTGPNSGPLGGSSGAGVLGSTTLGSGTSGAGTSGTSGSGGFGASFSGGTPQPAAPAPTGSHAAPAQQYTAPPVPAPSPPSPPQSLPATRPPGPYTGPQQLSPVPAQQNAPSLADAVKSAHQEGQDFGESVARDAPALWLEAVLARKPRMPSDLEARLLQGSSLPIDFLLHDEVRHALRRGFWDALERSRR